MHWTVAAPFIDQDNLQNSRWLNHFVLGSEHQFQLIPRRQSMGNWHNQKSTVTTTSGWLQYGQQAMDAVQQTECGVITVFPQLAATVGAYQQITQRSQPVVAWMFYVGTCVDGLRRQLTSWSVQSVDRFVVHTNWEREIYHRWLGLPIERFEFVPYQCADIPVLAEENRRKPFIAALGSAHRDFPTLFAAVERLKLPTVVASGERALAGLTIPDGVQTPFGISKLDCWQLAQEARINVIPMKPQPGVTAAGQITIVEAMRMGRAVIVSDCYGAADYIEHGRTGLLVEPGSVSALQAAIALLWEDPDLRDRLGRAARAQAIQHFSDEAAGAAMGRILTQVGRDRQMMETLDPRMPIPVR